jgi:hypothetical protein
VAPQPPQAAYGDRPDQELTALKAEGEVAWLKEVPHHALQQAVMDLHKAFTNFFEGRADYPTFRRKGENESFRLPDPLQIKLEAGSNLPAEGRLGRPDDAGPRVVTSSSQSSTTSRNLLTESKDSKVAAGLRHFYRLSERGREYDAGLANEDGQTPECCADESESRPIRTILFAGPGTRIHTDPSRWRHHHCWIADLLRLDSIFQYLRREYLSAGSP